MRDTVTTLVELAGIGCLVAAGYLVALPLGLFVAGVSLLAIGIAAGRE